jgi:hypothetical protein
MDTRGHGDMQDTAGIHVSLSIPFFGQKKLNTAGILMGYERGTFGIVAFKN